MEKMINYGIDLGTTNSAIAKFVQGEVVVFNNPMDYGRSTLPSVVTYQKDKIFVGSQAKLMFGKQKKDSFTQAFFKRKMGTSESFPVEFLNRSVTPIDLSAQVLKELKTFVINNEKVESAVITIPASFDLIQSNATKEAGLQAGLKQVVLLQEPIAASLAFANMKRSGNLDDGLWLVYDLGGGTFDVALIRINQGEMKVIDHEGNNFLGGADFDQMIVDKLILPRMNEEYSFENLMDDMKSASGKYNSKYQMLLRLAEDAKIRLSAVTSSEIVVDGIVDAKGYELDFEYTLTRSDFISLIKPLIDDTIELIRQILTRNNLASTDVQFTLMVGGSTYIPFVRQRVEEVLRIPVNCEIDPTTAVAIGAAYYASTKKQEIDSELSNKQKSALTVKTSYNKASKEREELFAARFSGELNGLFYKIVRQDGGFDSGLKPLKDRISEDLPLVDNVYNFFVLSIYDDKNNPVEFDSEPIGINSGFGISGQPLPEDICIEVDDYENPGMTRLLLVFERNTILPSRWTMTFPINRNISKGSSDVLRINILQGSHASLPESNKTIGYIGIKGNQIIRDISKGSDLELSISLSESQDLHVSAYLNMSDQEFTETFNPKERHTEVGSLKIQLADLNNLLDAEILNSTEKEDYVTAHLLNKLKRDLDNVIYEAEELTSDDITDKRYQLEDKKRKIAHEIDNATRESRLQKIKDAYFKVKTECLVCLDENGNDYERKVFKSIESQEMIFLTSNSALKIKEKSDEFQTIISDIKWRTPEFLVGMFNYVKGERQRMNDQPQANSYFDAGRFAIESENWDRLREVNFGLLALLPKGSKEEISTKIGFGL